MKKPTVYIHGKKHQIQELRFAASLSVFNKTV